MKVTPPPPNDPVKLDPGPLPLSAWAGWKGFDREEEVEAAKSVPYCRPKLRAATLSSVVYAHKVHRVLALSAFLIFCSISIFLLASLVAGRRPQCTASRLFIDSLAALSAVCLGKI